MRVPSLLCTYSVRSLQREMPAPQVARGPWPSELLVSLVTVPRGRLQAQPLPSDGGGGLAFVQTLPFGEVVCSQALLKAKLRTGGQVPLRWPFRRRHWWKAGARQRVRQDFSGGPAGTRDLCLSAQREGGCAVSAFGHCETFICNTQRFSTVVRQIV